MGLESGKTGHAGASDEVLWSAEHSGTPEGIPTHRLKNIFV
jgi:hypothetical protein